MTLETLPPEIATGWITKDGRAKVEVLPKGDPNDNETLRTVRRARCRRSSPNAIGGPISILESGHTMIKAFFEAGTLGAGLDRASCCGSCCAASATCC